MTILCAIGTILILCALYAFVLFVLSKLPLPTQFSWIREIVIAGLALFVFVFVVLVGLGIMPAPFGIMCKG